MKPIPITAAQWKEARDLVGGGAGIDRISKTMKVGKGIARKLRDGARDQLGVMPNLKFNRHDVRESVDEQIANIAQGAVRQMSKVVLAARQERLKWTAPKAFDPVGIAFMGDMHLGCEGTDYEAFDRDVEYIVNTPGLYVVIGGDCIDNHIKHLAAVVASRMKAGDQWIWLGQALKKLLPKTIAIVGGNHEAWTCAMTGFDPLKNIASKLCVPYDSDEVALEVTVGKQTYLISVRHKYRFNSSYNASHSVKQLWSFGSENFDVGVVCDQHVATTEPFVRHGIKRWALRPGTYQVASKFARVHGYHGAIPVTPAILLCGDKRRMLGVDELDWASEFLSK